MQVHQIPSAQDQEKGETMKTLQQLDVAVSEVVKTGESPNGVAPLENRIQIGRAG